MNCKPGQMAYITGTSGPFNGFVVTTLRYVHGPCGYDGWEITPALPNGHDAVLDQFLRPLDGGETNEESTESMRRLHDTTVKQGEPA